MRSFDELWAIAADRKGGDAALEALLAGAVHPPLSTDDRWLATFTRSIFNAGFNWKVVEAKWDGFEAAFAGFDVGRCAHLAGEDFDRLMADTRIVRHGPKIRAVQENAVFLQELAAEHGSATRAILDWPATDFAGLLALLKARGTRLGGNTGQYALRFGGRDGYILARDVVARLVAEGVIDGPPASKRAMAAVQAAFNTWAAQSGRSLTEISRVLAMSL